MTQFRYTALDHQKHPESGFIEATDSNAALSILGGTFSLVTTLEPVESRLGEWMKRFRSKRISAEDRLAFTQQLSEMLEGGMSMQASFDLLIRESPQGSTLQALTIELAARLRSGIPLSESLGEHPENFDRFFLGLVRAGELSGKLPLMLTRLARYQERAEHLKRQVQASLVYPAVVLSFALCLIGGMIIYGVPRIATFYGQLGAQLPLITRFFLFICNFLLLWCWLWIPLAIVGAILLGRWARSETGGTLLERLALRTPVRTLVKNVFTAKFTRTLGTLYGSGVALTECLSLVGSSVGSHSLEKGLQEARTRVQAGEELAAALKGVPLLTPMVIGMVAAGQESGALDNTLNRLADLYESKSEAGLRALLSVVEPLMVITIGLLIGCVILALGLPFINLGSLLT